MNTDEDLDVSRTEYDKGYTLYGFNLATDHDQVLEVSKRGSVRIDLKFDVALAHTINVIVCAEYENVIQIDALAKFELMTSMLTHSVVSDR